MDIEYRTKEDKYCQFDNLIIGDVFTDRLAPEEDPKAYMKVAQVEGVPINGTRYNTVRLKDGVLKFVKETTAVYPLNVKLVVEL